MAPAVKRPRAYSTTLRQEQADLTRQRVLAAARRLFVTNGFSAVTMQAIAAEAGVAYQTVYLQFGNKLQLALELCTSDMPHVGPTIALVVEAEKAGDPEAWLQMIGTFARRLYEPCAEILRFMRESGEPELIGRYRAMEANRFERLRGLGPQLARTGRLRDGVSPQQAADLVWTLAGPETYERLVVNHGWSPDVFERWLGPALLNLLLAPE